MHEKSSNHSYEELLEDLGLTAERGKKVAGNVLNSLQSERTMNTEESRIRGEMFSSGERLAREEEDTYDKVSKELERVGFSVFARSTENLGQDVANLERKRTDSLASFIDARFSSDPKESKAADGYWGMYYNASSNRADLMAGVVDSTRRGLFLSNDPYFESISDRLSHMGGMAEDQNHIANALRNYIDNPIESRERELDLQVEQYVKSVQSTLDGLVSDLESAAGGLSLSEAISKIGNTLVGLGNKDYYDAIKKYVAHKAKSTVVDGPNQFYSQAETATAKKPSSSAQKEVNRVLELLDL